MLPGRPWALMISVAILPPGIPLATFATQPTIFSTGSF
jgi:hypothetical protein